METGAPEVAQQQTQLYARLEAEHAAAGPTWWSIATEAAAASRPTAAAGLQHTFLADFRLCGGCFYFELQVIERIGDLQFGFCTEFESRKDAEGEGAGAMARGRGLLTAFG